MYAAFAGIDTVPVLVDHGADVNAKDDAGQTASMHADEAGFKEIVQMLSYKLPADEKRFRNTRMRRTCKDLDEKAASKIAKYKGSMGPSPSAGFLAGHRQHFWADSKRAAANHTSVYLPPRAFFNTLKSKTGLMVARAAALGPTSTSTAANSDPETAAYFQQALRPPHPSCFCPHFHLPVN